MKLKNVFSIIVILLVVLITSCKKKEENPIMHPTVTSTNPIDKATSISKSSNPTATFSVAMDPLTMTVDNFTLKKGSAIVLGEVTYSETTATFTPEVDMDPNTVYNVVISIKAKDLQGNSMEDYYYWSFTTALAPDLILPVLTLTDPATNATGVLTNKVITATFSKLMDPLTIKTSTFTLNRGNTAVPGTLASNGITATFTPTNILSAGTVYTAMITTGAKDLAGNGLANNKTWSFTTAGTVSGLAAVDLGVAGNYVILAKTGISNISTSAITGDLGLSPAATSYITGLSITDATGYATSAQVTGKLYAADMADPTPINLTTAVNNMITAYTDAAGRPLPDFTELGTGNIGGKTLVPGLYKWTSSVTLPSDVTISGGANDVWIFQISGDLVMSNAVNITLIGGAQAKNIFWQVAGQATIGTTSHFEGVILSMTGINLQTGASINGRALAQTAVVLDGNTVTKP